MFIVRLISGAVLLALSFLFILLGGYPLVAVLWLLSIGAVYELTKALKVGGSEGKSALSILCYIAVTAYYVVLAFDGSFLLLTAVTVFSVIMFLMAYVFTFPKFTVEDTMGTVFAFMYAPIMLSFVYLTRGLADGKFIVWMIFISSWGYDTFAYCVGMITGKTIGNHKVTPKLSPKKSIEGVIGGIVGAALLAWLFGHFVMAQRTDSYNNLEWMLAIMAAVGAVIAQVGDLAASAIKRNKDIKDYGKCIPGHGGVLDRFDSMIFTAPITYFLAVLLLNIK